MKSKKSGLQWKRKFPNFRPFRKVRMISLDFTLKGFCGFVFLALVLFCLPHSARAVTLTTCLACDGDKFAITFSFDSDNGTTSVYDVTLLADTSGNTLGNLHINAVAVGINGVTVDPIMDFFPSGTGTWTGKAGGLSSGGTGGCDGSGAFICAQSNTSGAPVPNASTATTPYEWTWDVSIPDSTPGGPASVFALPGDVKVNYSEIKGHHVSSPFTFSNSLPPSEIPEPSTLVLLGAGLVAVSVFVRSRLRQH